MEDCAMWSMIGTKIYKKCAQVYKLEEENKRLEAENKMLKEALEHIVEYWNRDENGGAMSDALWHILETAEQAL